ncbi:MAG: DUF2382 domain-containing protein [Chloroflexota bacterium]|nr:DUF2382 domain-containing protein [Chloroflexota bacterium]
MSMMDISQVQNGWDVYGSDGEKIGDVNDVGPNYLLVTKGFLFTKDIYIPPSAITGIEQDRVYINVAKDQVDSMGWDQAPVSDTGYGTAAYGNTDSTTYTDEDSTTVTTETTTADTGYVAAQPAPQPVQSTNVTDDDSLRVQRYEEELQAQKVQREAGEVRVTKDVVEEQQTLEVPVTREEVHVESHIVNRPATDTSQAFQEGTISVPVREEDVQVRKEVRVAEELEIEKTAVQETERVADTVRREVVNVEQVGDVEVEGGTRGTTGTSGTSGTTRS